VGAHGTATVHNALVAWKSAWHHAQRNTTGCECLRQKCNWWNGREIVRPSHSKSCPKWI